MPPQPGVFVVELLLRMAVFRRRFWRDGWSWFDMLVVGVGLLPFSEGLSAMRAFRVFRLLRIVSVVPSLRLEGLLRALPGLGSIVMLLLVLIYVFSVMATKLLSESHAEVFGSLGASGLASRRTPHRDPTRCRSNWRRCGAKFGRCERRWTPGGGDARGGSRLGRPPAPGSQPLCRFRDVCEHATRLGLSRWKKRDPCFESRKPRTVVHRNGGIGVSTPAPQKARDVLAEMERVFALQQARQWHVRATSAEERKVRLRKLKAAVEAHADEIVAAVRQDIRKPEHEIRITEYLNVVANIDRNIDNLEEWMQPVEVAPSLNEHDKAKIVHEARGVCLILGPWNFPLGLVLGPLAAAVAAGNCCIVKLSDLCPATARVAAKIIREAFDEREVATFEGGVDVATALLELPFDHIFFTGSTRVGKLVMAAAAKHLATVTLELGGKSPVIVDEGADVRKIAGDLAAAKQFNGGQACICPDYVFVTEQQRDDLIDEFRSRVEQNLYDEGGNIKKESIAQIVNSQNFARIKRLFDDAVAKGARVAVGGVLEEDDRTIHPTLLTDVTPDMLIMQEEIFAPIVPLMTYESIDDVVAYVAAHDKPLALYIYSDSKENVDKVLSGTSSGGVTVNGFFSHYLENRLPFGGVNQSGMGSYHGVFGFRAFSHQRAIYMHEGH